MLRRVPSINLLHDPLCPSNSVSNGANRGGNPRPTVVLSKLPSREDGGGDQQHALAPFIHFRSLALSLCLRHNLYN